MNIYTFLSVGRVINDCIKSVKIIVYLTENYILYLTEKIIYNTQWRNIYIYNLQVSISVHTYIQML